MTEDMLKIEANPDGVWLSVLSNDLSVFAVHSFLRAKGVRKYDEKVIEKMMQQKTRFPQKIAERNAEEEKDAGIVVQLSRDNMTASVTIEPPFFTKPYPGEKDVEEALPRKNVVFGIDREALRKLVDLKLSDEAITVARGEAPQNGTDARIELIVDPDRVPETDQDAQKIDHRLRSTVVNVHRGETIAVRYPPAEGKNGTSVIGSVIRAVAGKDIAFPAGSGVEISADGCSLVAATDGCLIKKDGKLSVLPELEIHGDVDFGVGNIDFAGNVKISGAVREGFRVVSTGNIEIREMVEGAHVESAGHIVISGGVRGMGRARIIAGGDVTAGFADQAWIRSRGDVRIRGSLFHSEVTAQNSVIVTGGQKSQIAGGKIQAGHEIICETLGSEMGTKTEISVGLPPEQMERRKELQSLISQNGVNLEKLEANLAFLKKQESAGSLDEEKRKLMLSATKMKFQLQSTLQSLRDELGEIEEHLEFARSQGIVRVREICYPGVSIIIRGSAYVIREAIKFAAFVNENGEVRLRSFDS